MFCIQTGSGRCGCSSKVDNLGLDFFVFKRALGGVVVVDYVVRGLYFFFSWQVFEHVHEEGYGRALVLEDDVVLNPNADRDLLMDAMRYVPVVK